MQRTVQAILLTAFFLLNVNCATIIRGTSQDFRANSSPAGARVLVNGEDRGATPTSLTLKRNRTHQITFQMDGYEDVIINLDRDFKAGPTLVGNFFSWWIIGVVVDVANGSAYQLTPEELDVTLRGSQTALDVSADELQVIFFTPDQLAHSIE